MLVEDHFENHARPSYAGQTKTNTLDARDFEDAIERLDLRWRAGEAARVFAMIETAHGAGPARGQLEARQIDEAVDLECQTTISEL